VKVKVAVTKLPLTHSAFVHISNKQRDLTFSESVCFLAIVKVTFATMEELVKYIRYDGCEPPEKRDSILEAFKAPGDPQELLVTRAAGGAALDISQVNIVILCEPWWKNERPIDKYIKDWKEKQQLFDNSTAQTSLETQSVTCQIQRM
jgi:hypothetical protein